MASFIPAVQLVDGYPRVSSLSISEHFERRHTDVLRSIGKVVLECPPEFNERNFALVDFTDAKGEKRPMYQLSRDGFTLVAMGFTGKRALEWKVRYIEAFNAMECALLEGKHGPTPDRLSTPTDRAPLRALVHAWSISSGQRHEALWPQVKAHFQLSRINDLPTEWIGDALAFVQSKIDEQEKNKALPTQAALAVPQLPNPFIEPQIDRELRHIRVLVDDALGRAKQFMTDQQIRPAKPEIKRSALIRLGTTFDNNWNSIIYALEAMEHTAIAVNAIIKLR